MYSALVQEMSAKSIKDKLFHDIALWHWIEPEPNNLIGFQSSSP